MCYLFTELINLISYCKYINNNLCQNDIRYFFGELLHINPIDSSVRFGFVKHLNEVSF